jgi:predicted nucleic acid-binding protein
MEQHLKSGGLLVSPIILAVEIAATVARVTRNPVAASHALSQLRSLYQLRLAPLDQTLVDDATNIAMNFGLRGADSSYVAVAQQLAIPLVTFDNEQLTRPGGIIATIRP